jgi:3D (Asp-Asp-Asp) domain-containing protein
MRFLMKKILIMLLLLICCGASSIPTYSAEERIVVNNTAKTKKVLVGYEYTYKTVKVKVKKKTYLGRFWITHYCPCSRCCGVGGGRVTASGTVPTAGRTVGVNPRLIPYGTKLKVGKEYGYVAEDTGGGIGWQHLDIFCNSHQEALNAGVGYKKVWIVTEKTKKKKKKIKIPVYTEIELAE